MAPPSAFPTAAPSDGAFEPMAWPPDGDAPCAEPEAPDAAHGPYRGELRRIEAIDPSTVRFELCTPDVAFRAKVSSPALTVDDTAWLQSHADGGSARRTWPGTDGTWSDTACRRGSDGQDIELARTDDYHGEAAKAAAIVFRWSSDPAAQAGRSSTI